MNAARLWLWSLALFVATLFLHTRHNSFPYYYHQDEPGKTAQVLGTRGWNFHHPMLLLSTTKLLAANAQTEQSVVEVGRWVSASFTAGAVVALSLLGYVLRGSVVAILTGLALMLHHQLFELSHYMKEDTSLLFGLALALLGAHVFVRKPCTATAMLLGVGCGLTISGKYIGVIALLFAVPALLHKKTGRHHWITVLVVTLLILIAVNFPLLRDPTTFLSSLTHETELIVTGHGKMTQSVPHTYYWSSFLANTTPIMWVLILTFIWSCARHGRDWNMLDWFTFSFPFAFAIALSFFPKENDRYFLPATALFTLLAAIGVVEAAQLFGGRERIAEVVAGSLFVLSLLPSWTGDRGGLIKYWRAFQSDDISELVAWLRTNTAPSAVFAADEKVRLNAPQRHGNAPAPSALPNKIYSKEYVADIGEDKTIEALQKMGVTHIVITPSTYEKFSRGTLKPKTNDLADYQRYKRFYSTLRHDYEPIRAWPRSNVLPLHPGIEVYCIAP